MEHLEKGRVRVACVGGHHLETWDPQWLTRPALPLLCSDMD